MFNSNDYNLKSSRSDLAAFINISDTSFYNLSNTIDFLRYAFLSSRILANKLEEACVEKKYIRKIQKSINKRLYHHYLIKKRYAKLKRSTMYSNGTSIRTFEIPFDLLKNLLRTAEHLKDSKERSIKYNIYQDKNLLNFIYKEYVQELINFFGVFNTLPFISCHLRYCSSSFHGNSYLPIFDNGKYDNLHFDEDVFSVPLIIYLSDVKKSDGPFEYIKNSEKNIRKPFSSSISDVITHDLELSNSGLDSDQITIPDSFPEVIRETSSFKHHSLYEGSSEPADYVQVLGSAGKSIIFHGYQLVHGGGLPLKGERVAALFNIRFTKPKLANLISLMTS